MSMQRSNLTPQQREQLERLRKAAAAAAEYLNGTRRDAREVALLGGLCDALESTRLPTSDEAREFPIEKIKSALAALVKEVDTIHCNHATSRTLEAAHAVLSGAERE